MSRLREATRASQSVLVGGGARIAIDGYWGALSQQTYEKSSPLLKQLVQAVAGSYGYDVANLRIGDAKPAVWLTEAQIRPLIQRAAQDKRIKIPESWLWFMLKHEPQIRSANDVVEYNALSISPGGSYKGLLQVGKPAWEDAQSLVPELGPFSNWGDPAKNVLAAAAFARKNVGYARSEHKYRGEFSPEIIYAMHNQGHTFLSSAKAGGMGRYASGQSVKAKRVLAKASVAVRGQFA